MDIVILWVFYIIPIGYNLFRHYLCITFRYFNILCFTLLYSTADAYLVLSHFGLSFVERNRKRSDSVLWHKSIHTQKNLKKQRDNTQTLRKHSITQRLWTDIGRSVGITMATKLLWLNQVTGSQPSHHSPQQIPFSPELVVCLDFSNYDHHSLLLRNSHAYGTYWPSF